MTKDLGRITNADITVWRRAVPRAFGKPFGDVWASSSDGPHVWH